MNQTDDNKAAEGGSSPLICSAADLLSQWEEAKQARREEIENRQSFMMPPVGIEEALSLARQDLNAVMWFLDKTLKLLASHESQQNDQGRATTGAENDA